MRSENKYRSSASRRCADHGPDAPGRDAAHAGRSFPCRKVGGAPTHAEPAPKPQEPEAVGAGSGHPHHSATEHLRGSLTKIYLTGQSVNARDGTCHNFTITYTL